MTKKKSRPPFFERLKKGLEEIILHAQGKIKLKTYTLSFPDKPPAFDRAAILALRERLKVNQFEFAGLVNVTVDTVRSWEDGKRKPGGAVARLLQVYAERPDVAEGLRHGTNRAARNGTAGPKRRAGATE